LRFSNGSQPDTTGDGVFCDGFESGDTSAWPSGIGGCREARATRPIYSSEGVLHSLDRTANVGASLADRYVFYFGSRPVASMELDSGSATIQYLSVDHLGTPALATDGSGDSVWAYGFEPFGRDWQAGTLNGAQENGVFLRFPGQWFDETWAEASLGAEVAHNLHRWYEWMTGRYSKPDPWGIDRPDGISQWYGYGESRPMLFVDPEGLFSFGNLPDINSMFDCFYCLLDRAGIGGLRCTEEAAWITLETSSSGWFEFGCSIWPPTGESEQLTFRGDVPSNTVGQAHTHPVRCPNARAQGPRPSPDDRKLADRKNIPVCTITANGVFCYDPGRKKTLRFGSSNWERGPKQRNCAPCEGIAQP
jgi:RHS repeat-associated protein